MNQQRADVLKLLRVEREHQHTSTARIPAGPEKNVADGSCACCTRHVYKSFCGSTRSLGQVDAFFERRNKATGLGFETIGLWYSTVGCREECDGYDANDSFVLMAAKQDHKPVVVVACLERRSFDNQAFLDACCVRCHEARMGCTLQIRVWLVLSLLHMYQRSWRQMQKIAATLLRHAWNTDIPP